jgi:hypothetical protein
MGKAFACDMPEVYAPPPDVGTIRIMWRGPNSRAADRNETPPLPKSYKLAVGFLFIGSLAIRWVDRISSTLSGTLLICLLLVGIPLFFQALGKLMGITRGPCPPVGVRPILFGSRARCQTCGYDLRASVKRCPECGTPFQRDQSF